MTKNYTKPIVTIDSGMAEGVYAASGATKGTLNVMPKQMQINFRL